MLHVVHSPFAPAVGALIAFSPTYGALTVVGWNLFLMYFEYAPVAFLYNEYKALKGKSGDDGISDEFEYGTITGSADEGATPSKKVSRPKTTLW